MPLVPGTRIGPYEILAPLGAGGMGEVYRARDSRLGRDVAIKALPQALAADPEMMMRFSREAKLLASLNHPNIASIYEIEEEGGQRFLVLEHVAGESLASRLARGPMPPAGALRACGQIAGALEAAHEAGVVHRDLKPGNVMVRPDDTVKVLDFGLAKGPVGRAGGSDLTQSPTMMTPLTAAGVILGTAGYMSPEQARGQVVDRRADVWAWGCVLFECLTGKRAFEGENAYETLAAVLTSEPDWSALPRETPPGARRLLTRCLRKDLRERQRDMGDVRIEIEESARGDSSAGGHEGIADAPSPRLPWLGTVAAGIAVAIVTLVAARLIWKSPEPATLDLTIQGPDASVLGPDVPNAVISPDGATLALVARDTVGVSHLWLRELSTDALRIVPGSDDASFPFWSPNSRSLGFFAGGQLRRISTTGEGLQSLCGAPNSRGGAWGADDKIIFAPAATGPLLQVRATGGPPRPATSLDHARGETSHRFPSFLPGGKRFLYVALHGEPSQLETCVGSPAGGPGVALLSASTVATYASPGYLLFRRQGADFAQRFDAGSTRCIGPPHALRGLEAAGSLNEGAPIVSASQNGVLAQLVSSSTDERLDVVDRSGHSIGTLPLPIGSYWLGQVSPEGDRIALNSSLSSGGTAPSDVTVFNIHQGYSTRISIGGSFYSRPIWTPDGVRVLYAAERSVGRLIYARRADATSTEELVLADMPGQFNGPTGVSPDSRALIFRTFDPRTGSDIWMVPLVGERKPRPLLATDAEEGGGTLSPDGRSLAYWSDESGDVQVYVRRFPELDQKSRVSIGGTSGLSNPRLHLLQWRSDGRELVFLGGDYRTVFAAPIVPGAQLHVGTPSILFRLSARAVDVAMSPDGQRFYVLVPDRAMERGAVRILVNWWRTQSLSP